VYVVAYVSEAEGDNGSGGSALIDSSGHKINVTYDESDPEAAISGTVTVQSTSFGGLGDGKGGTSTIFSSGISLDNTQARNGGAIVVTALSVGGDDVGDAKVNASSSGDGKIEIKSGTDETNTIKVSAEAAGSIDGDGANAEVISDGIDIVAGIAAVTVQSIAGEGLSGESETPKNGGSATVDAGSGAINFTVADETATSGTVSLGAYGQAGSNNGQDGSATVHAAGGIYLDNTNASETAGPVYVSAVSGGSYQGGVALIDAAGGDIVVNTANGSITVVADSGDIAEGTLGAVGGSAIVKANNVTLDLAGTAADGSIVAQAGDVSGDEGGTGGAATFETTGDVKITASDTIGSDNPGNPVYVGATGGDSVSGIGGEAQFSSASITVENKSAKNINVIAEGGKTTGEVPEGTKGAADATVVTGKIDVNLDGPGHIDVIARGGSVAEGSADSGNASLSADEITVKIGANAIPAPEETLRAAVEATGGNVYDGVAGGATMVAKKITVDTTETTTSGGTAVVRAAAGSIEDGGTGTGGSASIDSSQGDVLVKAGADHAIVDVAASDSTTGAGATASLKAVNLDIEATTEGIAQVTVTAGSALGTETGGNADVVLSGSLSVIAASNQEAETAGSAVFMVNEGSSEEGASGTSTVDVSHGSVTVKSGDATTEETKGGAVAVDAGHLIVGEELVVASGTGTAENIGALNFASEGLSAPKIDIAKHDGSLAFSVEGVLDSTKQNTEIVLTGTTAEEVYFESVNVGDGNRLDIKNSATAALTIGSVVFNPEEESVISVTNSATLVLGSIDARDSIVTFALPAGFSNGETFIKTLEGADFTGATVKLDDTLSNLGYNDQFILVDVTNGDLLFDGATITNKDGNVEKVYNLTNVNGKIVTVLAKLGNPKGVAYSEGILAQMAFLTTGSDLLSDAGTAQAVFATRKDEGPVIFSAFSFGHSRYETGSHIDIDSFNVILGTSYAIRARRSNLTVGAFFEYGKGSYDTLNSIANQGDVRSDGDVDYVGLGFLGRYDFSKSRSGSSYAEFAAHFGRSTNKFSTSDMPVPVKFKFDSNYFGLNLGFGKIYKFSEDTSFDLFVKYLWTHQAGEEIWVSANELVRFDNIESHRLRAGIRASFQATDTVRPYIGAAFEYESGGKAEASMFGSKIDVPELKGSTGIGEIGIAVNFSRMLTFDFGVKGYMGQRKGISGNAVLNFKF
jgi:hypothetical protein